MKAFILKLLLVCLLLFAIGVAGGVSFYESRIWNALAVEAEEFTAGQLGGAP